jgi:hypothetical protein
VTDVSFAGLGKMANETEFFQGYYFGEFALPKNPVSEYIQLFMFVTQ